jgi:hypothetical protein
MLNTTAIKTYLRIGKDLEGSTKSLIEALFCHLPGWTYIHHEKIG